jgi:hypothetical protein
MRKVLLILIASACVVAFAAPALAHEGGTRVLFTSQTAWTSFSSREPISPTSWRQTDTYVSVYRTANETYASVSRGLLTCTETTEPQPVREGKPYPKPFDCSGTWTDGYAEIARDAFTMDALRLTAAHLDATIPLQSYDSQGNPTGPAVPTKIVADWSGNGRLQNSNGHSSYCEGGTCFINVFTYSSRQAASALFIDGTVIGKTLDSYLSADRNIMIGA